MTEATEDQIRRWVRRHFPYVRLVRTEAGFDTYGFRYREELEEFRTKFTRKFDQYFSTTPAGRSLPQGWSPKRRYFPHD